MPSPPAIVHGQYYHIYNRGNNRENIFLEERNYTYFLHIYVRYICPIADTYAYCLLNYHFHFLVRIKDIEQLKPLDRKKKPGHIFGNLFNAYAKAFNKMYDRNGSLFQNPFGRVRITSTSQLLRVITYIHQNPQKHGYVDNFNKWAYSSFRTLKSTKPTHLERDTVINWFGSVETFVSAHAIDSLEGQLKSLRIEDYD
jgi:putative transposase